MLPGDWAGGCVDITLPTSLDLDVWTAGRRAVSMQLELELELGAPQVIGAREAR